MESLTADELKKYGKTKARLAFHVMCMSVDGMVCEYLFHDKKKWRLDYYHAETKSAYEYEGIFSSQSRHTSMKGFTGDTEKYNEAQRLGIKVYRFTAANYRAAINYLPKNNSNNQTNKNK